MPIADIIEDDNLTVGVWPNVTNASTVDGNSTTGPTGQRTLPEENENGTVGPVFREKTAQPTQQPIHSTKKKSKGMLHWPSLLTMLIILHFKALLHATVVLTHK